MASIISLKYAYKDEVEAYAKENGMAFSCYEEGLKKEFVEKANRQVEKYHRQPPVSDGLEPWELGSPLLAKAVAIQAIWLANHQNEFRLAERARIKTKGQVREGRVAYEPHQKIPLHEDAKHLIHQFLAQKGRGRLRLGRG